jgi:hypothetical protein
LQKYIEDPLSEELIRGRLTVGGTFEVYMVDGHPHYRPAGTEAPGLQLATV